jgi:MFS superfamily sulfate permease-like transporter
MDALISYAIVAGFFIGLAVILFASRTKRLAAGKKETPVGTAEQIKHSPA